MDEVGKYIQFSRDCSMRMTKMYSTSFSSGIRLFDVEFREPICSIYGFVRLADEIVDTFFEADQAKMILDFEKDTMQAIESGWSTNPILHAFQLVVHEFKIPLDLIQSFLESMKKDVHYRQYGQEDYNNYVYGSAEVVGLMCLKVFLKGDQEKFDALAPFARKLGSAFQKINFLRDIKSDYDERGRIYFPGINLNNFTQKEKKAIESEIHWELEDGLTGIRLLPKGVKLGVYLAYVYFSSLLKKIEHAAPEKIVEKRFRINNFHKFYLLLVSLLQIKMNRL